MMNTFGVLTYVYFRHLRVFLELQAFKHSPAYGLCTTINQTKHLDTIPSKDDQIRFHLRCLHVKLGVLGFFMRYLRLLEI